MIDKDVIHPAEKELYYWQMSDKATNFSARLYDLIAKADTLNLIKLELGFPDEVKYFMMYQNKVDYWGGLTERMKNDNRDNTTR